MRRIIIALCLVGAGMTGVVAEGETSPSEPVPAARELLEILEEAGDTPLSELTVSNLMQVADLASVAHQQQVHLRKSAGLSLLVPGLGQFVNGATGIGLGFFAADMAIHGTAAVVGYLLLPAAVKYANLNYLQTSFADIETRWKSLPAAELVPSAAVAISASILSTIVRHISSRHARDLAVEAIMDGTVVFEPIRR